MHAVPEKASEPLRRWVSARASQPRADVRARRSGRAAHRARRPPCRVQQSCCRFLRIDRGSARILRLARMLVGEIGVRLAEPCGQRDALRLGSGGPAATARRCATAAPHRSTFDAAVCSRRRQLLLSVAHSSVTAVRRLCVLIKLVGSRRRPRLRSRASFGLQIQHWPIWCAAARHAPICQALIADDAGRQARHQNGASSADGRIYPRALRRGCAAASAPRKLATNDRLFRERTGFPAHPYPRPSSPNPLFEPLLSASSDRLDRSCVQSDRRRFAWDVEAKRHIAPRRRPPPRKNRRAAPPVIEKASGRLQVTQREL